MRLLAIDPGPEQSAYVVWDGARILDHGKIDNAEMSSVVWNEGRYEDSPRLAIEMIACYGMPVGAEVFETCVWIGRFMERWIHAAGADNPPMRIKRLDVKSHLCHSAKANDGNIRQALIDRLGATGKKSAPGPTFGISGDEWAALAVAVTVWDGLERP